MMRALTLAAFTVVMATALSEARAAEKPYCVGSTTRHGSIITCGYATFEQCREEALSMRGWCMPNPYYGAEKRHGQWLPNPRRRVVE